MTAKPAEPRWTKGPWHFARVDPISVAKYGHQVWPTGAAFDLLIQMDDPWVEAANARLIAAAPIMADFIARVAAHFDSPHSPLGTEARAIMEKVNG